MRSLLTFALVFVLPLAGYAADNLPSGPEPKPEAAIVPVKPVVIARSVEHPTFDRQTKIELGLVAASMACDAVSTRLMLDGRHYEMNPVARPFVGSGTGSAAYFGSGFAAIVYGNHLLRNHPRWKHVMNWSVIAVETFAAAYNVH